MCSFDYSVGSRSTNQQMCSRFWQPIVDQSKINACVLYRPLVSMLMCVHLLYYSELPFTPRRLYVIHLRSRVTPLITYVLMSVSHLYCTRTIYSLFVWCQVYPVFIFVFCIYIFFVGSVHHLVRCTVMEMDVNVNLFVCLFVSLWRASSLWFNVHLSQHYLIALLCGKPQLICLLISSFFSR